MSSGTRQSKKRKTEDLTQVDKDGGQSSATITKVNKRTITPKKSTKIAAKAKKADNKQNTSIKAIFVENEEVV